MTKNILLIDDEEMLTELASMVISLNDYQVDTCNVPQDLENLVSKKQYDLVVTDLMMPGRDGFEIVKSLRAMDNYKDMPIIVMTAKTMSDEERKYLLTQNVHVYLKPFDPSTLLERIEELIPE
ncbi:hypothetical protein BVY03_02590 [bacterium K02(2017)]|nr:hypothetical protein BVY03_02590 [bacterium K02(2017)]